jgi:hypothetical protein
VLEAHGEGKAGGENNGRGRVVGALTEGRSSIAVHMGGELAPERGEGKLYNWTLILCQFDLLIPRVGWVLRTESSKTPYGGGSKRFCYRRFAPQPSSRVALVSRVFELELRCTSRRMTMAAGCSLTHASRSPRNHKGAAGSLASTMRGMSKRREPLATLAVTRIALAFAISAPIQISDILSRLFA